jgi:hypothetical protein
MDLSKFPDSHIAALTMLYEAGNQGPEGLIAVANIIKNRLGEPERFGKSIKEVCLKPKQFSCWIPDTGNNYKNLSRDVDNLNQHGVMSIYLEQALYLFEGVLAFKILDNTRGSNHYLTQNLFDSNPPSWAKGKMAKVIIRDHIFFRL